MPLLAGNVILSVVTRPGGPPLLLASFGELKKPVVVEWARLYVDGAPAETHGATAQFFSHAGEMCCLIQGLNRDAIVSAYIDFLETDA